MPIVWDESELAFLRSFVPGHTWRETAEAFAAEFGWEPTKSQLHNARKYYGIQAGIKGGARKGNVPGNKGKSWDDLGIDPGTRERMSKTQFKVGNVPKQGMRFRVGDERTDKEGYAWVKVCESGRDSKASDRRKGLRCWRLKHHLVWEAVRGEPVPPDCSVVFADRDRANFDPENIVAVPKGILSTMNIMGMRYYDRESLEACMRMAKIRQSLKKRRKESK